jgi:hypothetical protein
VVDSVAGNNHRVGVCKVWIMAMSCLEAVAAGMCWALEMLWRRVLVECVQEELCIGVCRGEAVRVGVGCVWVACGLGVVSEACVCGLEVMLRVGAVLLLVSGKMVLRFGRGRLRCDAVLCSVNGKVVL